MEPSPVESGRWIREGEDLALRLRLGDPRTTLPRGLAVEAGVVALLVRSDGKGERLAAGAYDAEALAKRPVLRAGAEVDLVLVQAGPVTLSFRLEEVTGKDGGATTLSFDLAVEIASVPKLVTTLLEAPGRLARADLSARLHAGVREAADAVLGRESLEPGPEPARVAALLEGALTSVGAGFGLRVTRVGDVALDGGVGGPDTTMQYGAVALPEAPDVPLELASAAGDVRRDPAREQALAQEIEQSGLSPEALAAATASAPAEPAEGSTPRAQPAREEEPEGVRCTGCGARLPHLPRGACPQCATPFG